MYYSRSLNPFIASKPFVWDFYLSIFYKNVLQCFTINYENEFQLNLYRLNLPTICGNDLALNHMLAWDCDCLGKCSVFTLFISLLSQSAAVGEAERLAGTDGEPQLRPPVLLWLEREDSQHSTGGYHETAGPASTHQTTPSHPPRSLSDLITVMTAASAAYIKRFRAAWNRG